MSYQHLTNQSHCMIPTYQKTFLLNENSTIHKHISITRDVRAPKSLIEMDMVFVIFNLLIPAGVQEVSAEEW